MSSDTHPLPRTRFTARRTTAQMPLAILLERLAAPDADAPQRKAGPGDFGCALPAQDTAATPAPAPDLHGMLTREVALLPRHWSWLNRQPGGIAAVLQQLVDEARRTAEQHDNAHSAREAAYRALKILAGDTPGFEQACCALFAGDRDTFTQRTAGWPEDVAAYGLRLAEAGWSAGCACTTACEPRPGP